MFYAAPATGHEPGCPWPFSKASRTPSWYSNRPSAKGSAPLSGVGPGSVAHFGPKLATFDLLQHLWRDRAASARLGMLEVPPDALVE